MRQILISNIIYWIMQIITAFIYYFLWGVVLLTLSLVVFIAKPVRRLLHKIQTKYQHFLNNQIISSVVILSFVVIFLILFESVFTFIKISSHFNESHLVDENRLEKLDIVGGHGRGAEDTIQSLNEYRAYYKSERNIMLTSSAFLAYFIFNRLFFNIRKLADIENQAEGLQQPAKQGEKKTN